MERIIERGPAAEPGEIEMAFKSLLINKCWIVNQALDVSGEPDGAPAITQEICRIEYGNKIVRNLQGENVVSLARIFLEASTKADTASMIRIDSVAGDNHPILSLQWPQDRSRIHHAEAYIG
jgi:hypothetical protein